ncbi:MAG: hypothetical protein ACLTKE_01865 [Coprococcus sp.]
MRVYGEDNITYEQYILNVIYMPSSELEVTDILLNDRALESFEQGKEEYFLRWKERWNSVKSESEVNTDAAKAKISLNGNVADGNEATFEKLETGKISFLCSAQPMTDYLK